ncbi:hypothetical protein WJX72_003735 [[Myrmecia] bisecta]|uniref:S phase cyclin A-associated protein in the endoplasmic reticulum n=1 Tax=[Myrmecia] bisecta TaxID=41462 RepID=A0AAW1R6Y1_9CHLO
MRGPSQTWTDAGEHASTSGADEADLRTSTEYADSLGWESEGCPSTPRATEAWKEKRNWSEILDQHGDGGGGIGGVGGGGLQKGRTLHQLLMSPERNRRKTPAQIKALIDEKHARAQRLRDERETQRMARLAQAEAVRQAVQTSQADVVERKRADIDERQARSAELRQAHLAEIRLKAGDETKKVHEVLFITSLQTQDRKLSLQQRLQETEQRRRQQLAKIQQRQRETEVAMQGAQERRHQLEAERRERIAGREKRAAAAAAKLEEERRALELARSQRAEQQRLALEQQKRAAEEEAERRQHRLASRLREAGMRRLSHLDQIRDRAAISKDERDSCPPMSPTKRPRSREVVAVIREVSASDDERRPQPLQTVDRSLTFSQVPANRLKGMRRRAAKLMARLDANRVTVIEDESLLGGREGMAVRDTLSRALADLQHVHGKHDAVGLEAGVGRVMQLLDSTRALGLNAARQVGLLEFVARALTPTQPPWPHRLDMALLALLLRLLLVEANCDFLLGGNLLAPIIPQLVAVLDRCNGREGVVELGAGQDGVLLNALLKVVVLALWHQPTIPAVLAMREHAVGYLLAAGVVHRLHELFSLFDPMASPEGTPYPAYLEQALRLLAAIAYHPVQPLGADKRRMARSQNAPALILTLKEVTLAGLLSLLTAVLLHAAPSSTPGGDAERPALPSNFCSVALGVLRVLNNAAFMDLAAMQRMLGSLDLRVEIFHVISFLLTFCTRQWHEAADQVKGLLNELLLLIGFFGVLEPCNQDVLQWGKAPNVVQKLCMLPAAYFSNRSLMHVLFPTLLVACYQNERICEVVEYQMGMHSLLAYVQQAAVADLASSSVPGSKASVPVRAAFGNCKAGSSRQDREPLAFGPGNLETVPFQAPIVAVTEKRCPRCELTKPAAQFNYSWQTSDRLQCYCKECKREVHNLRMAEARKREATPKVAQKQCRHCLQVLPASSFCISRRIADGLNSYCRKCNYEFAHKRSIKRRWPVTQPTVSEKRCTRCAVVKPAGMFSRRTAQRDGLQAYCKGCMREVSQVSLSKRAAASSKSTNAGQ